MPKFAKYGPHVPDALVQALEDDRVVIFCGAGVSMNAGLPSYAGLVAGCYKALGADLPPAKSPEWDWPDRMLGVLENDYPGEVRRVAADILSVPPTDLGFHKAILDLARLNHTHGLRLVTTNFDTYFEQAMDGADPPRFHAGPVLPIPRDDRVASWRTVAYLHGRLDDETANHQLVMTSADFGRAYLTEGWAARFVTRLFADFTVLFIGYSLNDPVLRYMTDAFAAEAATARHADRRERAYIFVEFDAKHRPDPKRWRDRGVEPIFYNKERQHRRLRETIVGWAEARKDYLLSAETLIGRLAASRPQSLDPSDTDNLMWAVLGRPGDLGHGARAFANLQDPPPIDWLAEIDRREAALLERWRKEVADAEQARTPPPARPVTHLEPLTPQIGAEGALALSDKSFHLTTWLARSLASPELVQWILEARAGGRRPHPHLRAAIRSRLKRPLKPDEPPLPAGYALFWRLVSGEGSWMGSALPATAHWDLRATLADHQAEPWLRQELLALLQPVVHLSPSYARAIRAMMDDSGEARDEPEASGATLESLTEGSVRLVAGDRMPTLAEAINALPEVDAFLGQLTDELTGLLRAALDLFAVLGRADSDNDPGAIVRPSIRPHDQNRDHDHWTLLVDLLWRGWKHLDLTAPQAGRALVERWRHTPYLTFQRLRAAAVTDSDHFTVEEKLQVLIHA